MRTIIYYKYQSTPKQQNTTWPYLSSWPHSKQSQYFGHCICIDNCIKFQIKLFVHWWLHIVFTNLSSHHDFTNQAGAVCACKGLISSETRIPGMFYSGTMEWENSRLQMKICQKCRQLAAWCCSLIKIYTPWLAGRINRTRGLFTSWPGQVSSLAPRDH